MANNTQSGIPLIVSASPHMRDSDSIPHIMWTVVLSLLPAGFAAIFVFGYYVLFVIGLCCLTALVTESVISLMKKQPAFAMIKDGSAIVTAILLAYTLPPGAPWYVPVVGSFFAIAVVKHSFGGLGNNIWNPALAARAFLQVAYPVSVNSDWRFFSDPGAMNVLKNITSAGENGLLLDAVTRATPLAKESGAELYNLYQLLIGSVPGCIGETSAIALLAGGLYLLYKKCIKWYVPVAYLLTVFVVSIFLPPRIFTPWANNPFYHLFAGGLFLGAFFMTTDMVTTPLTKKGMLIFSVGAGLLTILIRFYSGYPEGVCYSILIMNTATPLIDRFTKPRLYGSKVKK